MKWIKCSEQLPPIDTTILFYGPTRGPYLGEFFIIPSYKTGRKKIVITPEQRYFIVTSYDSCCYESDVPLEIITHWMMSPNREPDDE